MIASGNSALFITNLRHSIRWKLIAFICKCTQNRDHFVSDVFHFIESAFFVFVLFLIEICLCFFFELAGNVLKFRHDWQRRFRCIQIKLSFQVHGNHLRNAKKSTHTQMLCWSHQTNWKDHESSHLHHVNRLQKKNFKWRFLLLSIKFFNCFFFLTSFNRPKCPNIHNIFINVVELTSSFFTSVYIQNIISLINFLFFYYYADSFFLGCVSY